MVFKLPKIYPITDTQLSGLSHTEQAKLLIEGGARIIQLREKNWPSGHFFEDARTAVEIARSEGVTVLINDRVDIAATLSADGVHLGQDDLPPDEARKILGGEAIIGLSTHNLEQATVALSLPIDYIAIGPIFRTSTKAYPDPAVGLVGIGAIHRLAGSFPLVAIGGIKAENVQDVLSAGAASVAAISEIAAAGSDLSAKLKEFLDAAEANTVNTC